MPEDTRLALPQADQIRTDFAIIETELEAIHARLARLPTGKSRGRRVDGDVRRLGTDDFAGFCPLALGLGMQLDLTDEETLALLNLLPETIWTDRYPLSPRIRVLRGILTKFGPMGPSPLPPARPPTPEERDPRRRPRQGGAPNEIGAIAAVRLINASRRPGNIAGMLAAKTFLCMVLRAAAPAALAGIMMKLLAPA
jgi:hypothetical protein